MSAAEILFERRGAAGIVTLNRPKALNAVTHAMVLALRSQLDCWDNDAAITRVVVTGAGERAFSAGGDIRALYDLGKAGRHDEALQFWSDEYPLNAVIKNYRKPYVALINGIVMGGGVGVSVHGSHRVAGDRFSFAMPEVGIGFFPDVGATWFLPRMPGELGTYCALTGERFGIADALAGGIVTFDNMADLGLDTDAERANEVDDLLGATNIFFKRFVGVVDHHVGEPCPHRPENGLRSFAVVKRDGDRNGCVGSEKFD